MIVAQNLDSFSVKSTQDVPSTKVIPPLITTTQLDSMFQFLCPKPKIIKQFNGFFFVLPTELTVQLVGKRGKLNLMFISEYLYTMISSALCTIKLLL